MNGKVEFRTDMVEIALSKCFRVWQVFEQWTHSCFSDIKRHL